MSRSEGSDQKNQPPLATSPSAESTRQRDREIFRLAIPNILSNLSVPLLGLADTALMGRMPDARYLGAIALGGVLFNIIFWSFGFLRASTTGLTAQAFGRKAGAESAAVLRQSLGLALGVAGVMLLLQSGIAWLGFRLLSGEPEVEAIAASYFRWRIWAAPATLALMAFNGWFLGMQNARFPLYLTVLSNAANVLASILLVVVAGMGERGVALGTVIAQYLTLGLAVWLMIWRYPESVPWRRGGEGYGLGRYFHASRDLFLRSICMLLVFSSFTNAGAQLGETVLAANAILLQFFYLMSYGVDGFAYAAESLTGRFVGAREPDRLALYLRRLFWWGMGLGGLYGIAYGLAGAPLLRLFTDLPEVLALARSFLPWVVAVSLAGAAAFLYDGIYIGATATRPLRNNMLWATALVYFPLLWLGMNTFGWGNHAVWGAMTAFMAARSIGLGWRMKAIVQRQAIAGGGMA